MLRGGSKATNYRVCNPISEDEIKYALMKMNNEQAVGLDRIHVEVWKCESVLVRRD